LALRHDVQTRDKFLIIRLAGVGDVVMASTVVSRVRQERPGAHVTWLTGTIAAPLAACFAGVDDVIAVDEHALLRGSMLDRAGVLLPLWNRLRAAHFTDVVLLHADPRYRVITWPLGGARVFAQTRDENNINPIPGRYLGDEFARVLDGPGHRGPIVGHYPLAEFVSPTKTAPNARGDAARVAIVPAGTRNVLRESALKRWPIAQYVELARALVADGCEVVLVGDANDRWVLEHFAGLPVVDELGKHTLPQTVDTMAQVDLVISHDTGPMHLARLARVPLIALFGPTPPNQYVLADETTSVIFGGEHLACRPCYDGREFADCADNQCMSSISVAVVLETARTMLRRARKP
jgi:heptosyltransferase-2